MRHKRSIVFRTHLGAEWTVTLQKRLNLKSLFLLIVSLLTTGLFFMFIQLILDLAGALGHLNKQSPVQATAAAVEHNNSPFTATYIAS